MIEATGAANTDATPRIAVYMRVSTNEQKAQGTIETQRGVLTRYLDREDLAGAVYGWYEDEAVSGYKVPFAQRPAGARLMADVRAGYVNTILVRKLDRLGRNTREVLNAVHELETAGVTIISLKETVDTRTYTGYFFLTLLAGVAQLEAEMIAERTQEGLARRLESTTWMGGRPPYGYRVEGERKDARLVINDVVDAECGYSEKDVVRLMYRLLVEDDWATDRIAAHLTDAGIPTRDGKPVWSPQVVWRLLKDPAYMGLRSYRDKQRGTVYTHPVPAILTSDEWERVQATLREHKRYNHTKRPNRDNLLLGLIRCARCGALYVATNSRISTTVTDTRNHTTMYPYYRCGTRMKRQRLTRRGWTVPGVEQLPDCDAVSVAAPAIEAHVWANVEEFIRNPGHVLTLLAQQRQSETGALEEQRAQLSEVQHALEKMQEDRDKILALYRRDRIKERDLDRQLDAIGREEADLVHKQEQVLAAMQRGTDATDQLESARTLLQHLHARLDTEPFTPDLKRELVRKLVQSISVETEEVGLSARGKVKRRARATITWVFDPAAQHTMTTATHDEHGHGPGQAPSGGTVPAEQSLQLCDTRSSQAPAR